MTTGSDQRLRVVIEAVDRASQTIKSIAHRLSVELREIGRRMLFMGGLITGFAAVAVGAAQKQQLANALLRFTVESLGDTYSAVSAKIDKLIAQQDKLSKFNRTELTDALNQGATALGNLDAAMRALPAAVALASGTGMGVRDAMKVLVDAISGSDGARKAIFDLGIDIKGSVSWTELITQVMRRYAAAVAFANTPTDQLKGSLNELAQVLGERIAPTLQPIVQTLTSIVRVIGEWSAANPVVAQSIAGVIAIVGPLLVFVGTTSIAIGALIRILSALSLVLIFLGGPFGAVGLALAVLGAQVIAHADDWKREWDRVVQNLTGSSDAISGILIGIGLILKGEYEKGTKTILDNVRFLWDEQVHNLSHLWNVLANNAAFSFADMFHSLQHIWSQMLESWKDLWSNVQFVFDEAWHGLQHGIWQIRSEIQQIISAVQSALTWLSRLPGNIGRFMPLPGPHPGPVPFAHGGIVTRPTVALLGETGPEAVVPLTSGAGSRSFGITYNFYVTGPVYADDLGKIILEKIRSAASHGGFNRVLEGR